MKPWYKKWWVWLLGIVALFLVVALFSPDDDSASSTRKPASAASAKPKQQKKSLYKVGDSATIDNMKLTVNSVTPTSDIDDNISTPKSGNQYYVVKVTLKNIGDDEESYDSYDFQIKSDGNKTDLDEVNTKNDDDLDSGDLAAGGHVTGVMTGQAKKDGQVELIYSPDSFNDKHVTFKLQ